MSNGNRKQLGTIFTDNEVEFLQWFYCECDFGPAHEDVISIMHENYTIETGREIPEGYRQE